MNETTGNTDNTLTRNAFLGGQLQLWQPRKGYRAGIDPVLLAASIPACAGQMVLELGCGAGAAVLCLGRRVPGLDLHGVEVQATYADLARRNAEANAIALQVFTADLDDLPAELRQISFDHVIANPPYFRPEAHTAARDKGRAKALGEGTPLATWVDVAARRLAPRGYLHMIQRMDRLPDLLAALLGRIGSPEVLPLAARTGRAPELFILRARKDGRAAFILHNARVLHPGAKHMADKDSYTVDIANVLRNGAPLDWPAKG